MAKSFAHKWGQIIGNLSQEFICETLQLVADKHELYLDYQKTRKARSGVKVSWQDRNGNSHDLDYVLERGGTEDTRGVPAAFIETAWRRYTKHSKNKVQEIESAVVPIAETYSHLHPFLGVILAGVFTKGALDQMWSKGFNLLYIQYQSIVNAFAIVGIDASYDETTSEDEFQNKIAKWQTLTTNDIANVKAQLLRAEKEPIEAFLCAIEQSLSRHVQGVTIVLLHGRSLHIATVAQAIEYIHSYLDTEGISAPVLKYEIHVRYNNGDVIHAIFQNKIEALKFLRTFT